MFEGSTASGAERAYRRAVDKLTELLVAEGAIHAVRLKQKSKTKCKKKIAATYILNPYNNCKWYLLCSHAIILLQMIGGIHMKPILLNCIATVIQPTGGSIQVEGVNLQALKGRALADYRGKKVGYLFQNFELLDNLTGRENILLPTSLHGIPEKESSQRLSQLAKYLEINDVLDKFPSKMSGGQRQRVAAARALILNPRMILADEPTGALDSKNARNIMEKLSGLNRDEQATILMVTHDSNAASFCKRILFIQDGVIFHELRRGDESRQEFYERILKVMAQLGGGSSNVL